MKGTEPDTQNTDTDVFWDGELRRGFMLGELIIYPIRDVLVKDGIHHHLSRRAMEVLLMLCSHAGSIVSRQAILKSVWGDDSGQGAKLSNAITEIRQVLGDHKEHPLYIQTLPRRGFRLIMPVLPLDQELLSTELLYLDNDAQANVNQGEGRKQKTNLLRWRHSRLFKVAGTYIVMAWVLMQVVSLTLPILHGPQWADKFTLLILIVGFPLVLLYSWWTELRLRLRFVRQQNNKKSEKQIKHRANLELLYICGLGALSLGLSYFLLQRILQPQNAPETYYDEGLIQASVAKNGVVVMPFKLMGNSSTDYSVEMLQSELLTFLSQSSQLQVTAERVVDALPADATLELIRARTGAKYVLEGKVHILDDQLNVTTTLIDTGTRLQVWANKSQAGINNQLYLHETLSRQVFNALTFLMPQDESQVVQFRPTEDIRAYDFYVQAKTKLKDAYNEEQLKRVEHLFLQALERDSEFDLAKAGLCQTYLELYSVSRVNQVFDLASQACQKAQDRTSIRAESEIALGRLYYESGEYEQALMQFEQALELQQNNSYALIGMAKAKSKMDQPLEAERLFLRAIQAEPGYWLNYESYGRFLFNVGRYLEASLQYQKQSVLQPKSEEAFNNLGAAYYLNSEFEKATENWQKALALKPSANLYSNLGTSLFFSKKFTEAASMYEQAVKLKRSDYVLISNLADAYKYIDKQQGKAKGMFLEALKLARESEQINGHDPMIKANIARFSSEIGMCQQADLYTKEAGDFLTEDPYIYYFLALAASNCNNTQDALVFLNHALRFGYPQKLLSKDHQFTQYQQEILEMQQQLVSKSQ